MAMSYTLRKAAKVLLVLISIALIVGGGALLYVTIFQEDKATQLYGEVKLKAGEVLGEPIGQETSPDGLPILRLEGEGGQYEIDMCTGAFVKVSSERTDLLPIWSAHNGCGGDVIIYWGEGQRFLIGDVEYKVVEIRSAPQVGGTVNLIEGINGDLVLQSCTYDGYTMKLLGVEKV